MWWTGGERGRSERRGRWGILARSLSWTWWSMPPWRAGGICRWPGWRGVDSKGAGSNLHDGQAADSARRDGCEQVREPRETVETRELPEGAQRDERDERDERDQRDRTARRARRARTARARRGDAGVHSHSHSHSHSLDDQLPRKNCSFISNFPLIFLNESPHPSNEQ